MTFSPISMPASPQRSRLRPDRTLARQATRNLGPARKLEPWPVGLIGHAVAARYPDAVPIHHRRCGVANT